MTHNQTVYAHILATINWTVSYELMIIRDVYCIFKISISGFSGRLCRLRRPSLLLLQKKKDPLHRNEDLRLHKMHLNKEIFAACGMEEGWKKEIRKGGMEGAREEW